MNKDQLNARWDTIKTKAKRIWRELTDEDFMLADGSVERLYGLIQERFGDSRAQIQQKMDRMPAK
jgi:uncharacterized protein YjbJ (UPF0337 family)